MKRILQELQYSAKDLDTVKIENKDFLVYSLHNIPIIYFSNHYASEGQSILRDILLDVWNENKARIYVTWDIKADNKHPDVRFYNSKIKPSMDNRPIAYFNYGIDEKQYEQMFRNLHRERVDSGIFWDFARDKLQKKKEKSVDQDLVENLTALKDNIQNKTDERKTHILIDRTIFIKFMEDRGFIDSNFFNEVNCENFIDVLKKGSVGILNKIFQKTNDLLNGDIFRKETLAGVEKSIPELHKFLTTDYKTNQLTIFPYKFDKISLPLISNIYESFLREKKQERGIYYTPESVVDLILDDTLGMQIKKKLKEGKEPNVTVFDPACGSGIFLVKALERLEKAYGDYFKKQGKKFTFGHRKKILTQNIYGVDLDENAMRIATFSLYLKLFEGKKSDEIRTTIQKGFKFPRLRNNNLQVQNSLKENVFKNRKFDCIVTNPPWGYRFSPNNIAEKELLEYLKDRFPGCSDKQSSQFFLMKVKDWSKKETRFGFVVNNSIFYNLQANIFREEFLKSYNLTKYIELSKIKDIIFKSSSHPGVILFFNNELKKNNRIDYYVPKHNNLSKYLGIVVLGHKNRKTVRKRQLLKDSVLWRIFVNGDLEDYEVIKKIDAQKFDGYKIMCSSGFQPKKGAKTKGQGKNNRKLVIPSIVHRYFVDINRSRLFNWNQELRRLGDEEMFERDRLIIRAEPGKDFGRLTTAFANVPFIFKHNLLGTKVNGMNNFYILQSILNSKLAAYYFYLTSPQWGKGTRDILRNKDIERFPVPQIDDNDSESQLLTKLSKRMVKLKENQLQSSIGDPNLQNDIEFLKENMDELVFNIYNLNESEKQQIRDFYLVNAERRNDKVNEQDIKNYVIRFTEIFEKLLREKIYMNAEYYISSLLGAAVCFKLKHKKKRIGIHKSNEKTILQLLTKKIARDRIRKYNTTHILAQKKIKIYEKDTIYIIKSNEFSDWTLTEAIEDVKEEIASYFFK